MPYYRIIVWVKTRKTPYQGIRLIHNDNINGVYNHYHSEATIKYGKNFVDLEVQMLSKLCSAVKEHIKKQS